MKWDQLERLRSTSISVKNKGEKKVILYQVEAFLRRVLIQAGPDVEQTFLGLGLGVEQCKRSQRIEDTARSGLHESGTFLNENLLSFFFFPFLVVPTGIKGLLLCLSMKASIGEMSCVSLFPFQPR